jgi:pimeloyl-ACP methyl ester carboxylesterase
MAGLVAVVAAVACFAPTSRAAQAPPGAAVRFEALDGTRLEGRTIGTGRVGIVLTHQLGSNASEWDAVARLLAKRGYRMLALNVRGTCPGQGWGCSAGTFAVEEIWQDVAGAARYLRARGVRSIVLMGGSMGGEASLVAAARAKAGIVGVVSLSGSSGFAGPIDPAEERALLRKVVVPKLFVAGSRDPATPQRSPAYQLQLLPPKKLLVVDSSAHGVSLLADDRAGSRVTATVLAFLASTAR